MLYMQYMSEPRPLSLSHLPTREAKEQLGELVAISLRRKGAFVVVRRKTGELTILDPDILQHIPDVEMASALLDAWEEPEIEAYLRGRDGG